MVNNSNNKLILNVMDVEYSGEYKTNELWQERAYEIAIRNIENLVDESKKIKERYEKSLNKTLPRIHDAIFISGGRGTGKTVFLYNLAKSWEVAKESDGIKANPHFLNIIDPTLLIDNDNFVNVVIAHIHNYVQDSLKETDQREKYYKGLGNLAESLGQSEYNHRDNSGLDRIISYQSSMDLESNFHQYVKSCCELLNAEALVLPIDDVDMALGKAHDILETIRRILSCPQLIPVVCGDERIYHKLLLDHFRFAGEEKYESRTPLDENDAKHLSKQYWRKIFPQDLRIGLLPLKSIISKIEITFDNTKDVMSAASLIRNAELLVCPLVNGVENSFSLEGPDTSRKLVQFSKYFAPYVSDKHKLSGIAKPSGFWEDFLNYAETSNYPRGYLVAELEISLKNESFKLNEQALFSLNKQVDIISNTKTFRPEPYFDKTLSALKSILDVESKWASSQLDAFNAKINRLDNTLIAMPPIEVYKEGLYVSSSTLSKFESSVTQIQPRLNGILLLNLFTHSTYYGSSAYTNHQLFFGKAFELFTYTLLRDFKDKGDGKKVYLNLIALPPLHSIYSVAPTKTFDFEESQELIPTNDSTQSGYKENIEPINPVDKKTGESRARDGFIEDIITWQIEHADILKSVREVGLSHLLSFVFNKVYNQLHLMKTQNIYTAAPLERTIQAGAEDERFTSDNLFHVSRRFEFVLLSAIGSFLKDEGQVALQNTAMTRNSEQLLNESAKNMDRAYKVNVQDFIDGNKSENQKLMKAIVKHPLFRLHIGNRQERDCLLIGKRSGGKMYGPKKTEASSPKVSIDSRIRSVKTIKEINELLSTEAIALFRIITRKKLKELFKYNPHEGADFITALLATRETYELSNNQREQYDLLESLRNYFQTQNLN